MTFLKYKMGRFCRMNHDVLIIRKIKRRRNEHVLRKKRVLPQRQAKKGSVNSLLKIHS